MIKFISDSMDERIKSPVLKPFYASWILINWKFLITLALSNNPISQRIVAADHYMSIWTGLYLPLIATVAYIVIYPWLTYVAFHIQRIPKELQRLSEIKSEKKFLDAKQINLEKKSSLIEKEDALNKRSVFTKVHNNQVLKKALDNFLVFFYNISEKYSEDPHTVKLLIAESKKQKNLSKQEVFYYLELLEELDYLAPLFKHLNGGIRDREQEDLYLTPLGRAHIIENKLITTGISKH